MISNLHLMKENEKKYFDHLLNKGKKSYCITEKQI